MTQCSIFHSENSITGSTSNNYTIDHWSPPSSPSGGSPSTSPPSSHGDNFSSIYQRSQQPYSQAASFGRNRIGSDTTYNSPAANLISTSAPSRKFSMPNHRNGYYQNAASGQNHHQSFMEQVRALGPFQPGMKEVPIWLKSLRLHKYTPMFQPMTYSEMMVLDEARLENLQVTKGARKKILQSVAKLRERVSNIKQLEKTIDENGDPRCLIVELRTIMNTPIAKNSLENTGVPPEDFQAKLDAISLPANEVDEENLPGHIVRVLFRLHNHLFANSKNPVDLEDEYILKLIQTYDKILNSESFTSNQKQHISTFKRLLRRVAIDREILPYNSERRHTFSSNYAPKQQRPRRKSMNSLSSTFSSNGGNFNHSPPMSSTPTPPPTTYYNSNGRRQSFTYNKYSSPSSQQISPKSDQSCGSFGRPVTWYRPAQQPGLSPHESPPNTPLGLNGIHQQQNFYSTQTPKGMPSPPSHSPTSQQNQPEYTYPVPNNVKNASPPQLNNFYQPYLRDANLQAIVSALSHPQVLELIKTLSNNSASQHESQREMVSQGIQAGTPDVHKVPPNYSNMTNTSTLNISSHEMASNLADHLPLSFDDKQRFIQTALNEDMVNNFSGESGSKLPALNQLHQKSGPQAEHSAFRPTQQSQMMTSWWNQNTEKKMGNNHTYENSHTGPSLMIPSLGYLHQEIVNKLWEPLPGTPPVLHPSTPQIDSKPLFSRSPSVQYRNTQPPIGTGANRTNNHNQQGNSNPPPFDFSSLLMASPLRL